MSLDTSDLVSYDTVMDYAVSKYPMAKVARALNCDVNIVKNYTRAGREIIKREGGSLFSLQRTTQLSLTLALVGLGCRPEFAARAAYYFTDIEEPALPGRPAKKPMEAFQEGRTYLCIYPGEEFDLKLHKPKDSISQLFKDLRGAKFFAVTLLDVTNFVTTLQKALENE